MEQIWWLLLNILENLSPHFKFSRLRTSFVSKLHLDVKLCFMYQHLYSRQSHMNMLCLSSIISTLCQWLLVPLEVIFQSKHPNVANVKK